jgi:peptide/nickel transport system permease protein
VSAVVEPVVDAEVVLTAEPRTKRRSILRRLLTQWQSAWAVVYLTVLGLTAVFASQVAPHGIRTQSLSHKFASPSGHFLLGADDLGRDLLSRMIFGARSSLEASVVVVAGALIIAIPVGLVAGYRGGWIDGIVMRFVDAGMSVPPLVLALAIAGVLGPGLNNLMIALIVVFTPGLTRLVRGQALAVARESFIEASKAAGTSTTTILRRRVLPNVRSVVIIQASFMLGQALLAEAGLSYLGLGAQPPNPSWGNMLRRAYDLALFTHPWQLFIPATAIALTVLAFFALGDGLRDALGVAGRSYAKTKRSRVLGITQVVRPRVARGSRVAAAAPAAPAARSALLAIEGLSVEFPGAGDRTARVLDDVSIDIMPGEMLGLVGESGSGKTMTSLSIMRLVPTPGRITGGRILFEGRDLLSLPFRDLRHVRGRDIAMIFQDPMTSLNPAFTIGNQLVEAQRLARPVARRAARGRAAEMLDLVGIPDATRILDAYAHELSGGMRQRVMIAMALINGPKLLIADEPTTGLDVTIQAQILALLAKLKDELGMAVLFVTHDLGVVAELCDRVVVMYAGQIVENSPVERLFATPMHPYSEGLLGAMPRSEFRSDRLHVIPGRVPMPDAMPDGCRFHPRCPYAVATCAVDQIELVSVGPDSQARCIRVDADDRDRSPVMK